MPCPHNNKKMDFVDCIPKNNINFRIILQKICTIHKKVVPLQREIKILNTMSKNTKRIE